MKLIDIDAGQALAYLDDAAAPLAAKRDIAADLVAALIDYLDNTEDDPDLEPSLGYGAYGSQDLEGDPLDAGELDDDAEPSLGSAEPRTPWVAAMGFVRVRPHWMDPEDWLASERCHPATDCVSSGTSQVNWANGPRDDREEEHDGSEPDVDGEWSLGWTEAESRSGGWSNPADDGEPSLGWTDTQAAHGRYGKPDDDREDDERASAKAASAGTRCGSAMGASSTTLSWTPPTMKMMALE